VLILGGRFEEASMARQKARPQADWERVLRPLRQYCPGCGRRMSIRYENRRTVATLKGLMHLRLKIRRCEDARCARHHRPYRPEGEGGYRPAAARVRP
jgi:hypothetical protein